MELNKHTLGPWEPTLPCLEPSCIRHFYNRNGCSNHMRSHHSQFVPDVHQMKAPISFNSIVDTEMSSPPTNRMSLDSHIVFKSPVQSGLLPIFGRTGTETSPRSSRNRKKPDWTAEDWSFAVFCGFFPVLRPVERWGVTSGSRDHLDRFRNR
jgi:hypothetical protein